MIASRTSAIATGSENSPRIADLARPAHHQNDDRTADPGGEQEGRPALGQRIGSDQRRHHRRDPREPERIGDRLPGQGEAGEREHEDDRDDRIGQDRRQHDDGQQPASDQQSL